MEVVFSQNRNNKNVLSIVIITIVIILFLSLNGTKPTAFKISKRCKWVRLHADCKTFKKSL